MKPKTYRHTATTEFGTFRSDFIERQYPYAVVYCGWKDLPEATARRVADKEGACYGWAKDLAHAELLKRQAAECANVTIVETSIRELP
jgi:hypothetical protein